jgi:hypothetical protein
MRRKIYLAGRLQILSFVEARRGISDSGGDATGIGRQVRRKPRRLHDWAEPADRTVRDSDSERPFLPDMTSSVREQVSPCSTQWPHRVLRGRRTRRERQPPCSQ